MNHPKLLSNEARALLESATQGCNRYCLTRNLAYETPTVPGHTDLSLRVSYHICADTIEEARCKMAQRFPKDCMRVSAEEAFTVRQVSFGSGSCEEVDRAIRDSAPTLPDLNETLEDTAPTERQIKIADRESVPEVVDYFR